MNEALKANHFSIFLCTSQKYESEIRTSQLLAAAFCSCNRYFMQSLKFKQSKDYTRHFDIDLF